MKTIVLFRRRPDLSRAAFRDYYETRHAPLAVQHVHFTKYVRNHLIAPNDAEF
ncbi:MAG: ethyl tert-butyl ether degradation EthD, partial [Rhodospirillales bacterium]|nr:ethyl tert-butyl ether degradation EthD [Rhodospirillales bacterium]